MRRRVFLRGLAAAAAWPVTVRGQGSSPIVGWLRPIPPKAYPETLGAFQQGLSELGFIEGRNVSIEHRWSEGTYQSLAPLAAELVQRRVAVIFTGGGAVTTLAAKAATSTIPIVFVAGDDPTRARLVNNINRPEGNVTGATLYAFDLELKKLELLAETVPQVRTIAILRNPKAPEAESQAASVKAVSGVLGRQIQVLSASTESEIVSFQLFSHRSSS